MTDRDDRLRVDATGTVHPVGRIASQQLRSRPGEWRLVDGPLEVILLRNKEIETSRVLKLAGEIRTPGALCDVVALIAQSSWHGELMVYDHAGCRIMLFDDGNLIGAVTTVPAERLGETLYRFGVVTREQMEAAVEAAAASGKRVGEAAIELEYITAEQLYPMMARQAEEVFYAALQIGEGMFYFFDRYDQSKVLRRHNLNAGALLMEGARRMDEMRFFREKVPNDSYVPVPTPRDKKPPPELAEIFAHIDGKKSIAEIGRGVGQLEFEVTRAIFQLVNGGFITMLAPRPHGPEAIVEAFNPAIAEIHRQCDQVGKGVELREGLSRFATGGGIYDPLFQGAGPLEDGTFKPDRLGRNLGALAGDDPDSWLIQLLHEYVGFALFHAGSLLSREAEAQLATTVNELLRPVRTGEAGGQPSSSPSSIGSLSLLDGSELPPSLLDS